MNSVTRNCIFRMLQVRMKHDFLHLKTYWIEIKWAIFLLKFLQHRYALQNSLFAFSRVVSNWY